MNKCGQGWGYAASDGDKDPLKQRKLFKADSGTAMLWDVDTFSWPRKQGLQAKTTLCKFFTHLTTNNYLPTQIALSDLLERAHIDHQVTGAKQVTTLQLSLSSKLPEQELFCLQHTQGKIFHADQAHVCYLTFIIPLEAYALIHFTE